MLQRCYRSFESGTLIFTAQDWSLMPSVAITAPCLSLRRLHLYLAASSGAGMGVADTEHDRRMRFSSGMKPSKDNKRLMMASVLLLLCGYGLGLLSSSAAFRKQRLNLRMPNVTAQRVAPASLSASASLITTVSELHAVPDLKHAVADTWNNTNSTAASVQARNFTQTQQQTTCSEVPRPRILVQQSSNALIKHSDLNHVGAEGPAACDKGAAKGLQLTESADLVAPIVILGHNRVNYLARCMMGLLKYWSQDASNNVRFPLFISIDGGDQRALNFAAAWKETAGVQIVSRVQDPAKCSNGDCNLTAHFKMLLQLFFQCLKAPRLIFLEEDLEVSPDFLSYFAATAPLLSQDPSLWCVSAWNDHGQKGRASNSTALYRTDILPGLGWMITRDHALPLIDKWPELYWDDWMREPDIRQDRQCIFPEVSRTYHYGKQGTHMSGDFFEKFLANTQLNAEDVDWSKQNLTYLLKDDYAATMEGWLSSASTYNGSELGDLSRYCNSSRPDDIDTTTDLVVTYAWDEHDPKEYVQLARQLPGMLDDIRGKRPRASYQGVVMVRCRGRRLFLMPVSKSIVRVTSHLQ